MAHLDNQNKNKKTKIFYGLQSRRLITFCGPSVLCWRSLERQFTYRKRTNHVAFRLEYSPKVYQSTEQVYYYA